MRAVWVSRTSYRDTFLIKQTRWYCSQWCKIINQLEFLDRSHYKQNLSYSSTTGFCFTFVQLYNQFVQVFQTGFMIFVCKIWCRNVWKRMYLHIFWSVNFNFNGLDLFAFFEIFLRFLWGFELWLAENN